MGEQTIIKADFSLGSNLIPEILGSQMVESHSIAIAEQMKNAKDAGATLVTLDLTALDNDKITISDNGMGMSPDNLVQNWFSLGGSQKKSNENMSGGKGVGRLSLFGIGGKINVKTSDGQNESQFFLNHTELENIPITVTPSNEKSTKIEISELDVELDLNDIEIDLENLKSKDNSLKIEIKYPETFEQTSFLKPEDVEAYIPMAAKIEIDFEKLSTDSGIIYNFSSQIDGNILYKNNKILPRFNKMVTDAINSYGVPKHIGKVDFELNNFFLQRNSNPTTRIIGGKDIQDDFLKVYEGINIYRNGFKIFGHGHDDWLKLAEHRVGKSGENIDNATTFGTIYLSGASEIALVEKTNREGFIKRKSQKAFEAVILAIVKQFGIDRSLAVPKIKSYKKSLPQSQPQEKTFFGINSKEEGEGVQNDELRADNKKEGHSSEANVPKNVSGLLKVKHKKIELGTTYNLKNKELFNDLMVPEEVIVPPSLNLSQNFVITADRLGKFLIEYLYKGISETLQLEIAKKTVIPPKQQKIGFFEDSSKFIGEIDLETIHPIVGELRGLDYNKRPLLHLIVLRTILESILQNYIDYKEKEAPKELKERVRFVVNGMLNSLKLPRKQKEDPNYNAKKEIFLKFKGQNKLTGLLKGIQTKFNSTGYDTFLHELTHNTSEIDERLALEIANDIILPLHVLFVEMKKRNLL